MLLTVVSISMYAGGMMHHDFTRVMRMSDMRRLARFGEGEGRWAMGEGDDRLAKRVREATAMGEMDRQRWR